jgi:chemotaxis protein CheX
MDTTTAQHQYGQAIEQIVENVFQTMMGLEVQQTDVPWPPPATEVITASISLAGTWKGAVLVECGLHEALIFTSRMIGIDTPAELNDDVRDALGELANMVGGNLKSILPGGVELSLPSVVWGSDYRVGICHAGVAHRWLFTGGGVTFGIILIEVAA